MNNKEKEKESDKSWYSDEIKKKVFDDPYRPLHIWDVGRHKQLLETLQERGMERNTGCWSPSEEKQMEENLSLYQNLNPDIDVIKIFYKRRSGENRRILKETHFWDMLAFNLCRTNNNIQWHFTNFYQKQTGFKIGSFSKHELKLLKKLVRGHGKDWTLISGLMNRTINNVSNVYNKQIRNNGNKGSWIKEEKEKFLIIANKLMHCNQEYNLPLSKISSRLVSDFVLTRSSESCVAYRRRHKKELLKKLLNNTYLTLMERKAMIIYIYSLGVCLESEIDRTEIMLLYKGQHNEINLKREFRKLKSGEVSNNDDDLKIIFENLYEKDISNCEVYLFKRINFQNVQQSMSNPRTIGWLKANYFILVNANITKFEEKTCEEIITLLHTKYCSKTLNKKDGNIHPRT